MKAEAPIILLLLDRTISNNAKMIVGRKTAIAALIGVGAIEIDLPPYFINSEITVDKTRTFKIKPMRSFIN
ncbi:MAG: hypothetical protein ACRC2R_18120 [Xenococcaceae cyanobacterium]